MSPKKPKPPHRRAPSIPPHSPTPPPSRLKAVAYCRVSHTDQLAGTSIEDQANRIRGYAISKDIDIIHTYQDATTSRTPFAGRAKALGITEHLYRGTIKAVIIYKLDRAFRDTVDCLKNVDEWEDLGIALHVVNMGGNSIDVTTPSGRFLLTVLAAAAEMERDVIQERCEAGRQVRRLQGKRLGTVPYGYDLDKSNNDLIPNPHEQLVIQHMHEFAEMGMGPAQIAKALNRRGEDGKQGGTWRASTVKQILERMRVSEG